MAELADAPDLGSGGLPVQVQVLLPAPGRAWTQAASRVRFFYFAFSLALVAGPKAQQDGVEHPCRAFFVETHSIKHRKAGNVFSCFFCYAIGSCKVPGEEVVKWRVLIGCNAVLIILRKI